MRSVSSGPSLRGQENSARVKIAPGCLVSVPSIKRTVESGAHVAGKPNRGLFAKGKPNRGLFAKVLARGAATEVASSRARDDGRLVLSASGMRSSRSSPSSTVPHHPIVSLIQPIRMRSVTANTFRPETERPDLQATTGVRVCTRIGKLDSSRVLAAERREHQRIEAGARDEARSKRDCPSSLAPGFDDGQSQLNLFSCARQPSAPRPPRSRRTPPE